jgi:hypothetical protein
MNGFSRIALVVTLSALGVGDLSAQWNVARFEPGAQHAYTTFGLDPAVVTSLGYGGVASVKGHAFQLGGEVGVAVAHMDARDFRVRLGARTSVARWRSLHVTGSVMAVARGTENSIYRGFGFGADVTGTAGVYRSRWFAAGEFGKDKAVITHITHSDWYRTYFYPEARDGWYLDAGGTFHYGVTSGITLGRTEVVGRFGWLKTEDFNDVLPPMYACVGVGFSF